MMAEGRKEVKEVNGSKGVALQPNTNACTLYTVNLKFMVPPLM